MYKTILLLGLLFLSLNIQAQYTLEVPSVIPFADMQLELTPEVRKKIQTDVDALIRYEKYFNAKVEKVDAHFPLIEQILREENVPEDIKYLVIQESALVGDAVSSSNAVGYWQFKAATGREVGLTINNEVDERMNIINATHGAARYFKNNNTFFDNWLYALLAYYAGPGGALKIADKKHYGAKRMKLDGNTHWYVIKYLAHKIAFERAVGKDPQPKIVLFAYTEGNGKTLAQVAKEFELEADDLDPYNRWVRKNRIPEDKTYHVIVPDYSGSHDEPLLAETTSPQKTTPNTVTVPEAVQQKPSKATKYTETESTGRFPLVRQGSRWGKNVTLVNNIPGIVANANDNIRSLSDKTSVPPSKLVNYNDLTSKQSGIIAGKPYYLKNKRNKAPVHYHVVEQGETLWSVSQRFGIKLNKLMRNNRMLKEQALKPGLVLWLRFIRPAHIPEEYRSAPHDVQPREATPRQDQITVSSSRPDVKSNPKSVRNPSASSQETSRQVNENPLRPVISPTASSKPAYQETNKESPPEEVKDNHSGFSQKKNDEPILVPSVSTQSVASNPDAEYHTVKAGETLYSIAKQYDLTIPQLTSYNNIPWDAPLKVGQTLTLRNTDAKTEAPPLSTNSSDSNTFVVHEVKSGETMYKVARHYEVTIKELMEWNDKKDFDVSIGEKLKVRKK
ncbi:LysM peptidoglycan-binding domain-containing protein [Catalinimonas niigatensis]|uniref:LysM peptidoglycan-binding domain-containing protein n=1 Tax=Catalinimonas niigatensis TaxID=1397264 RepID=UPI002665B8D5|nr:LysM peptidoglycan-binding domain-containing protein [Catalinimonas niigatensis]WPP48330.1 LysM peptidoglycan-binding domain-containing protein [Catalinimonas niigatensis]